MEGQSDGRIHPFERAAGAHQCCDLALFAGVTPELVHVIGASCGLAQQAKLRAVITGTSATIFFFQKMQSRRQASTVVHGAFTYAPIEGLRGKADR